MIIEKSQICIHFVNFRNQKQNLAQKPIFACLFVFLLFLLNTKTIVLTSAMCFVVIAKDPCVKAKTNC